MKLTDFPINVGPHSETSSNVAAVNWTLTWHNSSISESCFFLETIKGMEEGKDLEREWLLKVKRQRKESRKLKEEKCAQEELWEPDII